jgi:hypothetical protein
VLSNAEAVYVLMGYALGMTTAVAVFILAALGRGEK